MNRLICWATRTRTLLLAALAAAVAALAALPGAASAGSGPGTWTQADINTSINNALAYLDTQQNPDGSWGTTFPGAETALALGAYGVKGYANLSAAEQTRVQNGLNFLLGTQVSDGSFDHDNLKTYDTGTALIALSLLGDVPTTKDKPTAITNARNYLIANQQITANGASPCTPGGTSAQGGGW